MDVIVHDGVHMNARVGAAVGIPRRAVVDREREPSGHVFDVMGTVVDWTFHGYSGAPPVPCAAPVGYVTYQKKRGAF